MDSIGVYVCDDHQLMVDGLISILTEIDGIHIVGSGQNGQELLDWLSNNQADLILLDINMPIVDGLTACEEIGVSYPACNVIFLSMHNEIDIIHTIVESSAKGYLLKNSGKETVEKAIKIVMNGGAYFDDQFFKIKAAKQQGRSRYRIPKISKREKEVLKLITMEYTSIEIAQMLFISTGTVDTHRRNIISKLGVKNTAGLVRVAIEHKLV